MNRTICNENFLGIAIGFIFSFGLLTIGCSDNSPKPSESSPDKGSTIQALIVTDSLTISAYDQDTMNIFEPKSLELIDIQFMAFHGKPGMGITKADRHSTAYLRVFFDAFNCWRIGQCQPYLTFNNQSVPKTLFLLSGSFSSNAPSTVTFAGEKYLIVETPTAIRD
jgi:hypothetical protein